MKVYKVVNPDNPSTANDWGMLFQEGIGDAIFVTRSVDQALAWALQLSHNLDDWRTTLVELEVTCIRDLSLQPTKRWLKSDFMSWSDNADSPFEHPRMKRVKSKWWRIQGRSCASYSRWLEFGEEFDCEEVWRDTPHLVEALILPSDIISMRIITES